MSKYFTVHYKDFIKIHDISILSSFKKLYDSNIYLRIISSYFDLSTYVKKILKYINPYEYLYQESRDPILWENYDKKMLARQNNTLLNLSLDNNKILYYNLHTIGSLFFFELNQRYKLINDTTQHIYDITNKSNIIDACILINDRFYPTTKYNYTRIIPTFTVSTNRVEYIKNNINTNLSQHDNLINNNIFIETVQEFNTLLDNIKIIDFIHINTDIMNFNPLNIYNIIVKEFFNLYIFAKIFNRISIGGNVCITFNVFNFHNSPKIITLMAYAFEEYHITLPDANTEKPAYLYVILKNKKNNMHDYAEHLEQMTHDIETKLLSALILTRVSTKNIADSIAHKLIETTNGEIIYKIKLRDDKLKKLEKQVKKEIKKCNNIFLSRLKNITVQCKKVAKLIKNNQFTEEIQNKMLEYNLFECINWSKKYDMPLITTVKKMTPVLSTHILGYLFSYDKKLEFIFKYHRESNNLTIDTNIDMAAIPKTFKSQLSKYLFESNAIGKRNLEIYYQVKTDIDYYYKKKLKILKKKYGIKNFPSQIWLKLFEIYNTFNIIPKDIDENTKFKTFHFCDETSASIYATKVYINKKTNIKQWTKNAQCLNEQSDVDNIPKKYKSLYDFGQKNTGDINDPENLEYYSNKYSENDLVTVGCGIPYMQNDAAYTLTFSTFLSVFLTLKIGGSFIMKRNLPISNNQELFLLYLTYTIFDKMIMYKPLINKLPQEYYLIGIGYKGITKEMISQMKNKHSHYTATGLIDIGTIPETFTAQLYKSQEIFLDNFAEFVQDKMYFANNFQKITDSDWIIIKKSSKDKIYDWINNNFTGIKIKENI